MKKRTSKRVPRPKWNVQKARFAKCSWDTNTKLKRKRKRRKRKLKERKEKKMEKRKKRKSVNGVEDLRHHEPQAQHLFSHASPAAHRARAKKTRNRF